MTVDAIPYDHQTPYFDALRLNIGILRYRRVNAPERACDGICPYPDHDLPLYVLDVTEPKGGS